MASECGGFDFSNEKIIPPRANYRRYRVKTFERLCFAGGPTVVHLYMLSGMTFPADELI